MLHVMPFMGPDLEINSILFYSNMADIEVNYAKAKRDTTFVSGKFPTLVGSLRPSPFQKKLLNGEQQRLHYNDYSV